MKHVVRGFALLMFGVLAAGQQPSLPPGVPNNMTRYFVVFLVRGTEPADQAARAQLTQQHIAYIRQLIEARRYIFAGPFLDGGRVLGMAIAAARSEEEAREWASADPAVKSGEATVELHPAMFPSLEGVKVDYPPKPNP